MRTKINAQLADTLEDGGAVEHHLCIGAKQHCANIQCCRAYPTGLSTTKGRNFILH